MDDPLAELTDDMFVIETPSYVRSFIFEKPPLESIRSFVDKLGEALGEDRQDNPSSSAPVEEFFSIIGASLVQEFALRELMPGQTSDTLELVREVNKHYRVKLKKCKHCNFRTDSGFTMLRHLNAVTLHGSTYQCHYCGIEARSTQELIYHLGVKHNATGEVEPAPATYECPNCPFESTVKRKHNRHVPNCQRSFRLETNLQVEWEPPGLLPKFQYTGYYCEICDTEINDQDQLLTHLASSHKVRVHPKMIASGFLLSCQKCEGRFLTDEGLERHMLGSHGFVTPYVQELAKKGEDSGSCPYCGEVLPSKMLNHLGTAHNLALKIVQLYYKCKVCNVNFGRYRLFESHVYMVHGTRKKKA